MNYNNGKVKLEKALVSDASVIYNFYMQDKEELMKVFSYVNDNLTVEHEEKFFSNPGNNYPFVIKYNDEICGFALLYDYNIEKNERIDHIISSFALKYIEKSVFE